jgi:hypothetical protein
VNVVSLLLARSSSRAREIAVRTALGASSWHLLRQFLAEGLVTGAGAIAGILVAGWVVELLVALAPAGIPRVSNVSIDLTVLAATLTLALLVALVVGLVPAVHAWHLPVEQALKSGDRPDVVGGPVAPEDAVRARGRPVRPRNRARDRRRAADQELLAPARRGSRVPRRWSLKAGIPAPRVPLPAAPWRVPELAPGPPVPRCAAAAGLEPPDGRGGCGRRAPSACRGVHQFLRGRGPGEPRRARGRRSRSGSSAPATCASAAFRS